MRFDDNWGRGSKGGSSREAMLPVGTHTGEIVDAAEKSLEFKRSDSNPTGRSLVVRVAVHGYQAIEDITPSQFRGKIEAIARAAGVPIPVPGEEWDEEQLVGRTVTIEAVQATSKAGNEYVRIERWFPNPAQPVPESKRAPARSQSAKAHREFQSKSAGGDDIPF